MAIKKQEFYEGAALHLLIRSGGVKTIGYENPIFLVNDKLAVYLKYSTRTRGPWGFTFTADEQRMLAQRSGEQRFAIGLVCGSDGIAAVEREVYLKIAPPRDSPLHIACYRRHGEHYEVNGPDGTVPGKISPSLWQRLLDGE